MQWRDDTTLPSRGQVTPIGKSRECFRMTGWGSTLGAFGDVGLDLLMGGVDTEGEYVPGYIDSINANFQGDRELVREHLLEERVPQILRAAVEAMIEVRRRGRNPPGADLWAARMLKRTSDWIEGKGLPESSAADIQLAGTEYLPTPLAA